jgi:hypothetical protein
MPGSVPIRFTVGEGVSMVLQRLAGVGWAPLAAALPTRRERIQALFERARRPRWRAGQP